MKIILGLDIGVASIGWAVVNEAETETEKSIIKGMGSRIIPLTTDENDEFTKGNAISKNANRTLKRSVRRNFHRYKMRKHFLIRILNELNMMPDENLFKIDSLKLYGLRDKAVTMQISLQEIGRVLFHLNQKRGYKSNRKANNEEEKEANKQSNIIDETADEPQKKKNKGYLDLIAEREELIKKEGLTIGQHFYSKLRENPFYRVKDNIFLRSSYIEEFDKIWNLQKQFYPDVLTDKNYKKIKEEIIYFQRPLKSQKGLVSECRFEKHHKVAPKSSPLFQVSKVWQEINNLKIRNVSGQEHLITLEEKQTLFELLDRNEKMTQKQVLDALNLKPTSDYYINLKKDLEGNRTKSILVKNFKKLKIDRVNLLQFNLIVNKNDKDERVDTESGEIFGIEKITSDFEKEPLYKVWHLLYSIEENEHLIKKLKEDFDFSDEQAKAICKIDFHKSGYGNLSARAIRKILPYLQKGKMYSNACSLAGYRHSDYLTTEENKERPLEEKLGLYKKNSLRNPVVEKIINQVVNLFNAIIDDPDLGKPDEIRVELGRELKQNAEERNNTYSRNSKQNLRHKAIEERLRNELGFMRVSRRDIEKYKLWEEFGERSPYEPNNPIALAKLFNGDYDIEHIIPQSRLFDNSFNNKTIASRKINANKDNSTAFDYMKLRGDQAFHDYSEFVKSCFYKKGGISKAKLEKLLMPGDKIPLDFINRQLRETQYISREVKSLLSAVCRNVYATSGSVTDYLKHNWGVDDVLKSLNWDKYEKQGKTRIEKNKEGKELKIIDGWTKRDDHRHHAIDALVVACTKQSFIHQLNLLNQNYTNQRELKESNRKFEQPWDGFVKSIEDAVENILISFKSGKKVATKNINKIKKGKQVIKEVEELTPRGFLHKDFVYGKVKQYEKVPLTPRFTRFNDIVDDRTKTLINKRLIEYGNDPKKAFKDSEKDPLPEKLKLVTLFSHGFAMRYPLNSNFKLDYVSSIVNKSVAKAVASRLKEFENNPKKAFVDVENNPVWLNKEKGIFIKSVRLFIDNKELTPLHENENGEPMDYVITRNNHHIAIYENGNGELNEQSITFWEAFERKKAGLPIIDRQPKDGNKFITSMQQNEMFVFNMNEEELKVALKSKKYSLLSKNLYRVQKIAPGDYTFRFHLETTLKDKASEKRITSLQKLNCIKVKINNLGKIVKVGE